MKIGIAGIGRMGAAIATRLLGLGHEVAVWNRTADKARALAAGGARVASSPADLAGGSEIILTILTDAAAVDAVYSQLLTASVAGKLFIEMSTVRPETERSLAAKLRAKGAALVDCPVGGTVGPAKEGRLFGFIGGEAADVARAKPLLDQMCRRLEHLGPVGAGASMKLAINLPLMVYWQALGEALSLCRPLALDPARVIDILADTSGAPNVLKGRGATIAAALAGKAPAAVTVDVDNMRKDLRAMVAEARALGRTLPLAERTLECFDQASREGLGASDCSMLPVHWLRSRAR